MWVTSFSETNPLSNKWSISPWEQQLVTVLKTPQISVCVCMVKQTVRINQSFSCNISKTGYISVISTSVRLVQKKSSRQATLGWARRDSKSLSWKALVRVLFRRGRNLAANTSPVRLWSTRFTTPNVPLKHREMISVIWNFSRGEVYIHMKCSFTFQFPHEHHRQRITSFSSPVPPLSLEIPVDLKTNQCITIYWYVLDSLQECNFETYLVLNMALYLNHHQALAWVQSSIAVGSPSSTVSWAWQEAWPESLWATQVYIPLSSPSGHTMVTEQRAPCCPIFTFSLAPSSSPSLNHRCTQIFLQG